MLIGTIPPYGSQSTPDPEKFLFLLSACMVKPGQEYPKKVKRRQLGYFESHEKAEDYLWKHSKAGSRDKGWDEKLHHLEIEKIPMNTELVTGLGYWIYNRDGHLFQAYRDIRAPFPGVRPADLKFREKEMVEVIRNNKLELAVIVCTPPDPQYVKRLKGYARSKFRDGYQPALDYSDYVYNTITYEKGISPGNIVERRSEHFYDHSSFLHIFPLSAPVTAGQKKLLESQYAFYHQPFEG